MVITFNLLNIGAVCASHGELIITMTWRTICVMSSCVRFLRYWSIILHMECETQIVICVQLVRSIKLRNIQALYRPGLRV